jgi:hypothetical protein
MCAVLLPPGVNPIAVNKYINIKTLILLTESIYRSHMILEANMYGLETPKIRWSALGLCPMTNTDG